MLVVGGDIDCMGAWGINAPALFVARPISCHFPSTRSGIIIPQPMLNIGLLWLHERPIIVAPRNYYT
jgi:hypothetical protein